MTIAQVAKLTETRKNVRKGSINRKEIFIHGSNFLHSLHMGQCSILDPSAYACKLEFCDRNWGVGTSTADSTAVNYKIDLPDGKFYCHMKFECLIQRKISTNFLKNMIKAEMVSSEMYTWHNFCVFVKKNLHNFCL